MRQALESLPWASNTTIDFASKQATVTVETKSYDEKALLTALKDAGFRGAVATKSGDGKRKADDKPGAKAPDGVQVAFRVTGMKKTKSGAT